MAGNNIYVKGSYIDIHDNEVVNLSVSGADVKVDKVNQEKNTANVEERRTPKKLTDAQQQLLTLLEALIAKGDWRQPASVESIGKMMRTVLNVDGTALTAEEVALSERLWSLLETRRGGDALRVTWQNLIGYFDEQQFFHPHIQGSPSLSKLFFGTTDGYTNIDKGRPGKSGMLNDFKAVLPLLDKYCPQKT